MMNPLFFPINNFSIPTVLSGNLNVPYIVGDDVGVVVSDDAGVVVTDDSQLEASSD